MASTWINADNMMRDLMAQMNKEMQEAAEPVIRKAVEDAEKEMRKRLGSMFVGLIQHNFSMLRMGDDLQIIVRNERPNNQGEALAAPKGDNRE